MKTIKVVEATERQLDWLVATCEGYDAAFTSAGDVIIFREEVTDYFDPHRNWGWIGPIIEREGISIYRMTSDWSAAYNPSGATQDGPTPLIAAIRCYVSSCLGSECEVPDELL